VSGRRGSATHEMSPRAQVLQPGTGVPTAGSARSTGGRATLASLEGGHCFVACVAHELRTLLATQRALIELALADPNTDGAAW
jgi:hypothetical protein